MKTFRILIVVLASIGVCSLYSSCGFFTNDSSLPTTETELPDGGDGGGSGGGGGGGTVEPVKLDIQTMTDDAVTTLTKQISTDILEGFGYTVTIPATSLNKYVTSVKGGGGGLEIICNDQQDNDGDTLIDCADPDCVGQTDKGGFICEYPNETICDDGGDNDGDSFSDCFDSDCSAVCVPETETSCSDLVDNDEDGKVDCADSDCNGSVPCSQFLAGMWNPLMEELCENHPASFTEGVLASALCTDPGAKGGGENLTYNPTYAIAGALGAAFDGFDFEGGFSGTILFSVDSAGLVVMTIYITGDGLVISQSSVAADIISKAVEGTTSSVTVLDCSLMASYMCGAESCELEGTLINFCSIETDDNRTYTCSEMTFAETVDCFAREGLCEDGIDNDLDGHVDCDDEDCNAETACLDCIPTEIRESTCDDDIDNDCNGFTDCDDLPACEPMCGECVPTEPVTEITCDDRRDNDCDGVTDCRDADCEELPECMPLDCGRYPTCEDVGGDCTVLGGPDFSCAENGCCVSLTCGSDVPCASVGGDCTIIDPTFVCDGDCCVAAEPDCGTYPTCEAVGGDCTVLGGPDFSCAENGCCISLTCGSDVPCASVGGDCTIINPTFVCNGDCCVAATEPECGDGECNGEETRATCEADCGACTSLSCDNKGSPDQTICDAQGCGTCLSDGMGGYLCDAAPSVCGNGTCEIDETRASCEADCGACTSLSCDNKGSPDQTICDAQGCGSCLSDGKGGYLCDAAAPKK